MTDMRILIEDLLHCVMW